MAYGNSYGSGGESIIGGVFLIALVIGISWCSMSQDHVEAETGARQFAQDTLGIKNPRINCQNVDSGGDGYVSCTVVDPETKEVWPLQCSGAFTFNEGCALDTGKNRNANRSDRRGSW